MNDELLKFYNQELQHLRDMGSEFAAAFPSIAARLGLNGFECHDPYVERLLEGFSFLAARVQMKIEEQFPRFARHLIEAIAPHYVSPTPSMAIVQCEPDLRHPDLSKGFCLPRHTTLHGWACQYAPTRCEFRTTREVMLWPLRLAKAQYTPYHSKFDDIAVNLPRRPAAMLRLRLETTGGTLSTLPIDRLPLYLRGSAPLPVTLYELFLGHSLAMFVIPANADTTRHAALSFEHIAPMGLDDDEALLPVGQQAFKGHRLLHEYFAFPEGFLFVALTGLRAALKNCDANAFDVVLLLDHWDATLEARVDASNFALYCTPIVNLFPRHTDRLAVHDGLREFQLVVDRMRPRDFEVHSVEAVHGYHETQREPKQFMPFRHARYSDAINAKHAPAYFQLRREPRGLSERERTLGIRTRYPGSEVLIALVDTSEAPYSSDLRQLGASVLCTNRDLPLYMPVGSSDSDFSIGACAPVASVRCLAGPSEPQSPLAGGTSTLRIMQALTANYLSMFDPANAGDTDIQAQTLRELLSLHTRSADHIAARQIGGLTGVSARHVTRRLPYPGPLSFGRGLEISLAWTDEAIDSHGAFVLGAVLQAFFACSVSINHFTETVMRTPARGDITRWAPRMGACPIL